MKKLIVTLLWAFACINNLHAQESETAIPQEMEHILEIIQELQEAEIDLTQINQELIDLKKHPINLNTASIKELESPFFIHAIAAQKIIEYRSKFGAIRSYSELLRIEGIDRDLAKIIQYFSVLENQEQQNRSESIASKTEINFLSFQKSPKSLGYKNPDRQYPGHPRRYLLRGKTEINSRVQLGLVLEQDAGEQFKNYPDFISANISLKPKKTVFRKIIIGDYHLSYAQNLLIGPNFGFGKSLYMASWFRTGQKIKTNSSSAEYGFRRGFATEIEHKQWHSIVFASYEPLDIASNLETNNISGLHRTNNEVLKRHNAHQLLFGLLNTYQFEKLHLGLGGIMGNRKSRELETTIDYRFISANAKYRLQNGIAYLELVQDLNKNLNAIHTGLIISLAPFLNFATIYRNYPHNLYNPFANALSSQSKAQNENGFLTGLEWKLSKSLSLNAYMDHFTNLSEKELPSYAIENSDFLVQLKWFKKRKWELYARYRNRIQSRNNVTEIPTNNARHNTRLHFAYKASASIRISQRLEYNFQSQTHGMLLYCDLQWRPKETPWALDLRYSVFNVDDYSQRIYAYEASLPYTFSIPAYSNSGTRSYIKIRYKGFKKCGIWIYYGVWKYSDIQQISSGNNLIESNRRREVGINLRYRL